MKYYFQLMRFHKPIGTLLLLWPTLWALWIAGNGSPSIKNIMIFIAGVIVMRAAGCVINDIADRNFDKHVSRTKDRPLTSNKIKLNHAIILLLLLVSIAFVLVLFTNPKTIFIAVIAAMTALLYPFMKRYTHWPQLVLGIAFSCAIPMAFAAENVALSSSCWLLFFANIAWTIAYDTEYALVDRADDLKIGIKSTAILFGKNVGVMIELFQGIAILLLVFLGILKCFSLIYFFGLFCALGLFWYQHYLLKDRPFKAFLNNQWVGLIVFLAIFSAYY